MTAAAASSQSAGNVPFTLMSRDDQRSLLSKPSSEDDLPPDFKKKLHEWRIKKKQPSLTSIKEYRPYYSGGAANTNPPTPISPDTKKIDWQLWKTGQIKLEGQGLCPLPDEKDLPEDFQKKLGKSFIKLRLIIQPLTFNTFIRN